MVHRREGTGTGKIFLQPNDDNSKDSHSHNRNNHDNNTLTSTANNCETLPQLLNDPISSTKSPAKSKTPSPNSTPSTPTRKGRKFSQERSPRKAPSTPAKRSILRKETSTGQEANNETPRSQNGGSERSPKPLRSGLLRVSRLQSTSLIEAPTIARNRGRRKTICHSVDDISSVERAKVFGKSSSADNLVQEVHIEKLTCSLPLAKLSIGVMQSILSSSAGNIGGLRNHSSDTDLPKDPASLTNDIVGLSSPQTAAKLLCLYCDKKFTSQKLLCKHTDRVHATDGRRLSSRNSVASLSWPSIVSYPGCWYCGNSGHKLTAAALATSVADDLKALFHHFLDVHSDKYYACKSCELRFPNAESMAEHIAKRHSKDRQSKKAEATTPSKLASKRAMTEETPSAEDLTQPLHVNVESSERTSPSEEIEPAAYSATVYSLKTRRQIKQQAMQTETQLVTRSCQNVLRNNEDTILTRLGVAQNRLPRGRKGTRNRRLVNAEVIKPEQSPNTVAKARNKIGKIVTTGGMKDAAEVSQIKPPSGARVEPLSCTFDDDFYETVSINVRQNLSCHLDGKLDGGPTSPSPTIPVATVPAIRSTVVRSPLRIDSEIHEATALETLTAFPTLLTAEQYGSDRNTERKIKRPITKHSWKWKWDCVKKYKYVNEGGKIVKKIKQPISGLRDLSKLDMWTQLTMRTKHELTRKHGDEMCSIADELQLTGVAREEKLKQIAQLDSILDSRVFPQIVLEQTEQSVVKIEPECDIVDVETQEDSSECAITQRTAEEEQIPKLLHLNRRNQFYLQRKETYILSGEWARPRCYICFSCGGRFDILKTLEEHKVSRHPYIYSTHYEIVGRELIEGDLYKHLYIPVRALRGHLEYKQRIKEMKSELDHGNGEEESMDSVNSLSASTASANGNTTVTTLSTISSLEEHLLAAEAASVHVPRRCTKCKRMCNGKLELYRHMLNCFGDYAWRIAQKRKYRYFGVKSRRHARQNFQRLQRRKAMAKKEEGADAAAGCSGKSVKCSTVRSRPSDAETIRRMLENLPPKRACRQIIPNITKPRCIKFAKNLGLKKLVSVGCSKKVKGKAVNVASTTLTAISSNMRRKQRLMARQITRRSGRMAMRLRELKQNSNKSKCEVVLKKSVWPSLQHNGTKLQAGCSSPPSGEKCLNDKKCNGNGKKVRKVENSLNEECVVDEPDSEAQSDKTPKKKTPVKRGQDRSPKSPKEEESPSKSPEKYVSPKQSPKRDNPTESRNPAEPSTSKPTNPREPLNLVVPLTHTSSPLLQISPVNKRQRGKKLTDCIAKLQEKLGKPFFEGNENLDTVLSARQQSPPQNSQLSNSHDMHTNVSRAEVELSTRTPKRKTVTRKIIQKTNVAAAAFVAPKPTLIAPAIKIESEDDAAPSGRSCSKEENLSMTSDMYDSLVESDKCDVLPGPTIARKDNTLNELNDSAVSSMSTDSISIQNSTPEKRRPRPNLHELFPTHADLIGVRKSNRKGENTVDFLPISNPPEEYGAGTVLNLSLADLKKTTRETPTPSCISEKPTRKNRSSKSPPDSSSRPILPVLEEALNLTVTKRRNSSTAIKTSPPVHRQEPTAPLSSKIVTQNPACPISEQPKNNSEIHADTIVATCADNMKPSLSLATTSIKQDKKKAKSKKETQLPNTKKILEEAPVEQINTSGIDASLEIQKAIKPKLGSKNSKKNKTLITVPAVILTEQQNKDAAVVPVADNSLKHSKQEIQTVSNFSVDLLLNTPSKSTNSNPSTDLQLVDNSIKVSPVKSSPETKKGKGRPRKQNTSVDLLNSVVAENLTAKTNDSNPKLQTSCTNITPKRGRKSLTRDKDTTREIGSPSEPLDKEHLNKTEKSNENSKKKDDELKGDTKDSLVDISGSTSSKTFNEQPIGKCDAVIETVQSISDIGAPNENVKRKGRPKKSNIKLPPKGSAPNPQFELSLQKPLIGDDSIDKIKKKTPKAHNEGMCKLPPGEEQSPINAFSENTSSVKDQAIGQALIKPSGETLELNDKSSNSDEMPSSQKSVFDSLRAIQENVFFNRHDNKSLTRKYTRKSAPTIKKPIPNFIQANEMPSTSYSANNTDPVADITLNDGNYLVSSITETVSGIGIQAKPCKNVHPSENKSLETPKKTKNTRRSNRNKSAIQILPDNSSICRELDEIVASFLNDDEPLSPCDKLAVDTTGPTRFHNVEVPPASDKSASCIANNNDNLEAETKQNEKSHTNTQQKVETACESTDANSDQKLICKELSITLTKISETEIKAQKNVTCTKKDEAVVATSPKKPISSMTAEIVSAQQPRRTRGRRKSVKPEDISLTHSDTDSARPGLDALSPVESSDSKLAKKLSRKRKNTSSTNSMENIRDNVEERSSKAQMCSKTAQEDVLVEVRTQKLDKSGRTSKISSNDEKTDKPKLAKTASCQDGPASKQSTTRRRRKNELAAIVADQLLESFKEVDKSRIDELKKLENLAYEKSDDLYITGIRLTPLTKRKIVLSEPKEDSNPPKESPKVKTKRKTKSNDLARVSDSEIATTDSERPLAKTRKGRGKDKEKLNHENLFRNFAENSETPKLSVDQISLPKLGSRNFNLTFGTFRSCATQELTFGSHKNSASKSNFIPGSAETSCSVDSQLIRLQEESSLKAPTETSNSKSSMQRKMKKKMSRLKKEKKAETENINELRTGLESFTFGKNTFQHFGKGLFGSVGFIGLFGSTNREVTVQRSLSSSMPALNTCDADNCSGVEKRDDESRKPFLRPSLLSGIVTQGSADSKASRDPRLNKQKLKSSTKNDAKKTSKSLQKLPTQNVKEVFVKPRAMSGGRAKRGAKVVQSPKIIAVADNDEDDDDNCLVAIAQSVNNRIMSEEEFSQTDEFEVSLPAETSGQSLPLTTSREPSFLDEQKTSDVPNEDENTNTELIDMDLEDDASVYTSFSQDTSGKSRFGQKRRRRRSILLARRPKRVVVDPNLPELSFDCTICNKSFGKAAALAKHQQTFTHVQKLSEYEYLNKVNEPKDKQNADDAASSKKKDAAIEIPNKTEGRDKKQENDGIRKEKPIQIANRSTEVDLPTGEFPPERLTSSLPSMAPTIKPVESVPVKSAVVTMDTEPISSPEQADTTYDRYQNSIRIALSQEERLFYECCNMLKGSETPMVERAYPTVPNTYGAYDVPNKPVTPKSSERFSYLGSEVTGTFQHGTAYTVKSPMSQSRTSPRYAYPKIDINQFSDISSDSNPAFARTQHPHMALQSGAECPPIGETNTTTNKVPFYEQAAIMEHPHRHGHMYHSEGGAYYAASEEGCRVGQLEMSDTARLLTARTYATDQRGKAVSVAGCTSGYSNAAMEAERTGALSGNEQPLTSPLHSNSSQGSNTNITACRMRTKAAMKGYDNFKVSIPTLGLDLQQALERSPHGGCKLTALAEIALGSEAPITPPRYHQPSSTPSIPNIPVCDEAYEKQPHHKSKPDINEKLAKKYQELIMNNIKPVTTKTAKKKEICDNTGNKSGLRPKRKKAIGKANVAAGVASTGIGENHCEVVVKPPKDIYEFEEESQEPIDKGVGRGSPSKGRNSIVIPERPFKNIGSEDKNTIKFHKPDEVVAGNEEESQMSTTSYSDRDDFNYGSMSEGGDEESENEVDEQKSSDSDSCASAQTAKTHKCLIVGRIFGNANKNRPVENTEKPAPVVSEPKKKIPSQELNEMFDRLRKDGGKSGDEKRTNIAAKCVVQDNQKDGAERSNVAAKNAKVAKVMEKRKKLSTGSKVIATTATTSEPTKRDNPRPSRSTEGYFPREIAKLQAELGMTAEEIAALIGEGKRKSQRKCAINRPRTVVDTWSSDEYEDFLSTKDVIAFIEEQEKRSKKKRLAGKTENGKDEKKETVVAVDLKDSSKENQIESSVSQSTRRNPTGGKQSSSTIFDKQGKEKPDKTAAKDKKPQRVVDRLLQRFNKSRGNAKKVEPKPAPCAATKQQKATESKKPPIAVSQKTIVSEKSTAVNPIEEPEAESNTSAKKQPTLSVKPRLKSRRHTDNESESDFENELRRRKSSAGKRTTSKISKRRKTIAFKEEHNEVTSDTKYTPKAKQSVSQKSEQAVDVAAATSTALAKPTDETAVSTGRPLARRKRIASEMLYYWSSSSSDEEFGRIETNEDDVTQKDEYLPKHGWIVGDSHKKLVTLLATAKGKKMTDLKEPVSRKKS